MEIKSLCNCLSFIGSEILSGIEKHAGDGELEDINGYMRGMYNDECIEEQMSMLAVLSRINLIINRFYLDDESDIIKQYCTLRKHILAWLRESKRKQGVDDGEEFINL